MVKPVSIRLRVFATLGLLCVLSHWGFASSDDDHHPTEFDVKAAYLYNFAKFVQWPSVSTSTSIPTADDTPFCIGVLGSDPFGPGLDALLAGKMIKDRPLVVRHFQRVEDALACQVVYISASEEQNLRKTLASLKKVPVLTISDSPSFVQKGGVIGFELIHSNVRFDVNLTAAQEVNLQISSQLLKVAHAVEGKPEAATP